MAAEYRARQRRKHVRHWVAVVTSLLMMPALVPVVSLGAHWLPMGLVIGIGWIALLDWSFEFGWAMPYRRPELRREDWPAPGGE